VTRRAAGILYAIAAVLVAAAAALRLMPPAIPLPAVPPTDSVAPLAARDPSAQAAALLSFEEIVRANMFSPDRQAPRERYIPPELRIAATAARPPGPRVPRLQLFGVATGPSGAVALIDANPAIPGAEIYRLGDRVGIYRLESISDTLVVLRGDSGARRLRLESPSGRSQ
jgi:hypothetical protein